MDALSVGNGPPIIAIAGGPGISSAYLRDTLPRLAHHTLVFYDPRGSGASQSGVRPLSFASAVAEIEDLRLALDAEQVVLLAHSYGALPACVYAARRPRRVRALVLVSPAGLDWQAWQRDLAALQARVSRIRPAQHVTTRGCDHFVAAMERRLPAYFCDPGCARRVRLSGASGDLNRAVLAELGRFDLRLDMEAMPDSILIVWGRYDWIGGETREQWSRTLPQAHVVELGGSGHFPFVEEPEPFLGALVGFLETPSQQSSRIP